MVLSMSCTDFMLKMVNFPTPKASFRMPSFQKMTQTMIFVFHNKYQTAALFLPLRASFFVSNFNANSTCFPLPFFPLSSRWRFWKFPEGVCFRKAPKMVPQKTPKSQFFDRDAVAQAPGTHPALGFDLLIDL